MAQSVQLLLVENVDNLGIVGDVVKVRAGYARNYLLPFGLATEPSDELVAQLADKRKDAEKQVAAERAARSATIDKLQGVEVTMERAINDQGILYGSVTQQDISKALVSLGFEVRPRDVRLHETIKRLGEFDVHIKMGQDLETDIKLHVEPDREIEIDEKEEMEFDNEGNLIEKPAQTEEAQPEPAASNEG